jgi:predicted alpha/beta-hydrolase family hydrolase
LDAARGVVVLAHGGESGMDHPLLTAVAEGLAASGWLAARFNFPYREAGRKTPDPEPRLEAAWLAVTDTLHEELEGRKLPLVVGGKSLGAYIGAGLVAAGVLDAEALLFLGYPLHRPGIEEGLRDGPLRAIDRPMLFLAGARDRMCRIDLLERALGGKPNAVVHPIPGADHTLETAQREPRQREKHFHELADVVIHWLARSSGGRRRRR